MKIKILAIITICCKLISAQEKHVSVDGQKYRIKVFGEENVSVIFECGMSDSLETWGSIPDSVAKFDKVFYMTGLILENLILLDKKEPSPIWSMNYTTC